MKGRNVFRIPSEVKTIEVFFFPSGETRISNTLCESSIEFERSHTCRLPPACVPAEKNENKSEIWKKQKPKSEKNVGPIRLKKTWSKVFKFVSKCRSLHSFSQASRHRAQPSHRCHPNWNFILNSNFLGFALRWLAQGSMKINSVFLLAKKTFLFGTRRFYCPHSGKLEVKKIKNEI